MREFAITEISCVDSPAQVFARMTLMKRAAPDEQQETEPMQKITHDNPPRSFDSLESAMRYLAAQDPTAAKSDVMSKAAREHPALLDKYNAEGEQRVHKALDTSLTIMRAPPSVREFEALIREIKTRDGCDSVTALRRAKAEDPQLYEAYQSA